MQFYKGFDFFQQRNFNFTSFSRNLIIFTVMQSYAPEDNRFDLRQLLYNARWPYQFRKIDEMVKEIDGHKVTLIKATEKDHQDVTSVGGMGVIAAGSGDPRAGV